MAFSWTSLLGPSARGLEECHPRAGVWPAGGPVREAAAYTITNHVGSWSCTLSRDGRWLAGGTFEGLIKLWNVRTLREVGRLRGRHPVVSGLQCSTNGRDLVSAGIDDTTRRWSAPGFPETDAPPAAIAPGGPAPFSPAASDPISRSAP